MSEFDPQQFEGVLDLSQKALTTSRSGVQLVGAIQKLFGASKASGDEDLKAAIVQLTANISDAALANADLKMQLADLREKAIQADKFDQEKGRYRLIETNAGCHVLALDPSKAGGGEPLHYLCPNCINDRRFQIIQGDRYWRKCSKCDETFDFEHANTGDNSYG